MGHVFLFGLTGQQKIRQKIQNSPAGPVSIHHDLFRGEDGHQKLKLRKKMTEARYFCCEEKTLVEK